jgi:hypothetical protein
VSFYRPVCLSIVLSASLRVLLFAIDLSFYLLLRVLAYASFHHASMPAFSLFLLLFLPLCCRHRLLQIAGGSRQWLVDDRWRGSASGGGGDGGGGGGGGGGESSCAARSEQSASQQADSGDEELRGIERSGVSSEGVDGGGECGGVGGVGDCHVCCVM